MLCHSSVTPELALTGTAAVLEDAEAAHAVRARRLRVGDVVCVFDGAGRTAAARISEVIKRPFEVHLALEAQQHWAPPAARIHLTSALPKGDRQTTMLDMVTQLGVTDFTPVNFERSVSRVGTGSQDRWRRVLIESCKQSQEATTSDRPKTAGRFARPGTNHRTFPVHPRHLPRHRPDGNNPLNHNN